MHPAKRIKPNYANTPQQAITELELSSSIHPVTRCYHLVNTACTPGDAPLTSDEIFSLLHSIDTLGKSFFYSSISRANKQQLLTLFTEISPLSTPDQFLRAFRYLFSQYESWEQLHHSHEEQSKILGQFTDLPDYSCPQQLQYAINTIDPKFQLSLSAQAKWSAWICRFINANSFHYKENPQNLTKLLQSLSERKKLFVWPNNLPTFLFHCQGIPHQTAYDIWFDISQSSQITPSLTRDVLIHILPMITDPSHLTFILQQMPRLNINASFIQNKPGLDNHLISHAVQHTDNILSALELLVPLDLSWQQIISTTPLAPQRLDQYVENNAIIPPESLHKLLYLLAQAECSWTTHISTKSKKLLFASLLLIDPAIAQYAPSFSEILFCLYAPAGLGELFDAETYIQLNAQIKQQMANPYIYKQPHLSLRLTAKNTFHPESPWRFHMLYQSCLKNIHHEFSQAAPTPANITSAVHTLHAFGITLEDLQILNIHLLSQLSQALTTSAVDYTLFQHPFLEGIVPFAQSVSQPLHQNILAIVEQQMCPTAPQNKQTLLNILRHTGVTFESLVAFLETKPHSPLIMLAPALNPDFKWQNLCESAPAITEALNNPANYPANMSLHYNLLYAEALQQLNAPHHTLLPCYQQLQALHNMPNGEDATKFLILYRHLQSQGISPSNAPKQSIRQKSEQHLLAQPFTPIENLVFAAFKSKMPKFNTAVIANMIRTGYISKRTENLQESISIVIGTPDNQKHINILQNLGKHVLVLTEALIPQPPHHTEYLIRTLQQFIQSLQAPPQAVPSAILRRSSIDSEASPLQSPTRPISFALTPRQQTGDLPTVFEKYSYS